MTPSRFAPLHAIMARENLDAVALVPGANFLRLMGKDVEMLRFPAESHELSRSGSPVHRVMRFEAILEWFGRYLSPGV